MGIPGKALIPGFSCFGKSLLSRSRCLPGALAEAGRLSASDTGCPLLTRDRRRYAAYFPSLALVTPESGAGA